VGERLRVALIGPGWIAQRHLGVLATEPGVQLVGIVGREMGAAQRAAQAFGGRPYDDVRAMLDAERPDAAIIAVPPDAHGDLEAALLERGVHLLIEKPLASDTATPERIAVAARDAGVIAGVAYHWRAMDTIPGVVEALVDRPPRLLVAAWHDALPVPAWWRDEARGGGQVVEQATHLVDLARRLAGEATLLHATMDYEAEPSAPSMTAAVASTATLRFDTGAIGTLTATCKLAGYSTAELKLLGDHLAITIRQDGVLYEEPAPGGVHTRYVTCGNDPIRDEDRAFFAAIRANDPSLLFSTYDDALRTHRLTTSIRSMAAGA
jgi:myo-inositol 2-dehydrogenase / D-chiro-inositol 1-dehydrogenase